MKKEKLGNFRKNSFESLLKLSEDDNELKKIYKKGCFINGSGIKYPPMKLLDLYFWLIGITE